MILAQWKDRWFLASKVQADTPSCALVAGDWPGLKELAFLSQERSVGRPGEPGFSAQRVWRRFMDTMVGITFYPEVRYRGMKVFPERWLAEGAEPLLYCRLMGDQITKRIGALPAVWEAFKVAERTKDPAAVEKWRTLARDSERGSFALREFLISEGWRDEGGDGLVRYLHVDELEKTEGPPSEGAF